MDNIVCDILKTIKASLVCHALITFDLCVYLIDLMHHNLLYYNYLAHWDHPCHFELCFWFITGLATGDSYSGQQHIWPYLLS